MKVLLKMSIFIYNNVVRIFFIYFHSATILKQELPVAAMFVNGSKRNEQSL
jgi:hypothetical protein